MTSFSSATPGEGERHRLRYMAVLLPENLRVYFELSAQAWILYKAPQWNERQKGKGAPFGRARPFRESAPLSGERAPFGRARPFRESAPLLGERAPFERAGPFERSHPF
jgi:hypothetical protein